MGIVSFRSLVVTSTALLALAACEEGSVRTISAPETTEDGSIVIQQARTEIQEVERGDIFSAKEMALWDGRPSLGGVWVAHPDVADPERVRITNTETGQVINGALFRRERMNPGPRIQMSSDAAAALDILAGQPTELELIVLRQEEVVIEPAILAPPPETTPAATEAGETDPVAEDAPDSEATDGSDAATMAVVGGTVVATAAASDASAPKEKGFWQRFRDSLSNEPKDVTVITPTVIVPDVAETAAAPSVETAPLDAIAVASAAIAEVEAEETAVAVAPEPAPPAEPSGVRNPFIQIGLFGEQANASAAASSLRQAGIVPTVAEGENANGPFWRILVGPVNSASDQSEMLAQVKALGYSDAFLTPN